MTDTPFPEPRGMDYAGRADSWSEDRDWDQDDSAVAETSEDSRALWPGDTGELADRSRRALLELIRGPYLSRESSPQNWAALLADRTAITMRLHELFMDLVLDPDAEFAFVRSVADAENGFPRAVRTQPLSFLDSAMLLALRQRLIAEDGGRVIVGQDELYEELQLLRTSDRDEADFTRRLNASWGKMVNTLRVLHVVGGTTGADAPTRAEISPVVRMLIDADRVRALQSAFQAVSLGGPTVVDGEEMDDALKGDDA